MCYTYRDKPMKEEISLASTTTVEAHALPITKTDILILGAGIGGYEAFRTLNKHLRRAGLRKTITIVDQNNYFTFTPLLHEVAAGSVEAAHATIPLRELTYKTPHHFVRARVQKVLPAENKVVTTIGEITYEYCVIALGSGVNFFNIPGAEKNSYTVRTLTEAMRLRSDLMAKVDSCQTNVDLTIVGGGYTGVEVAGQLQDLIITDIKKLYPEKKVTMSLVQSGPTLVPMLAKDVQAAITKRLTKMGVALLFNSGVKKVNESSVLLSDGTERPSDLTVWCAGFSSIADEFMPSGTCERGRVGVTHFLNHPDFANLYGVGDIICGKNEGEEMMYPQLGEAAHRQGEYVGRHIVAAMGGKKLKPFYFKSLGTIMPIGDGYGIVAFKHLRLFGWFAWWIRRTVYVAFMPGLTRKIKIVVDWTLRLFGFSDILDVEK